MADWTIGALAQASALATVLLGRQEWQPASLRLFPINFRLTWSPCAVQERIYGLIAINFRRAIHRFDNANSVVICAVFFANPR